MLALLDEEKIRFNNYSIFHDLYRIRMIKMNLYNNLHVISAFLTYDSDTMFGQKVKFSIVRFVYVTMQ